MPLSEQLTSFRLLSADSTASGQLTPVPEAHEQASRRKPINAGDHSCAGRSHKRTWPVRGARCCSLRSTLWSSSRRGVGSALLPSLHLAFEHHEVVHELLHAGAGRSRDALGRGVIRRSRVPPSFSVRRDSERASRRSAVIACAVGGSGLSMPPSIIPLILRCTTTASRCTAPRHQGRKLDPRSGS